jgi:hypothetical protein
MPSVPAEKMKVLINRDYSEVFVIGKVLGLK